MTNNIFLIVLTWFMTGCGGSSPSPTFQKGFIIDSPVSGLDYECDGMTGETNDEGMFECTKLPVTFKIGNLTIGSIFKIPSDKKVYPQDIVGKARSNFSDAKVIELTRFLQSLDDDQGIEQMINITPELKENFTSNLILSNMSEEAQKELIESMGKTYVSEESAIIHLRGSIEKLTSILITPNTMTVSLGSSVTFIAEGNYSNSVKKDISSEVSWSSSNPTIAMINGAKIETKSLGDTTITATYKGVSTTATLIVTKAHLASWEINASNLEIEEGKEIKLLTIGTFSDKTTTIMTSQVTWSSSDTNKATVDATGTVTTIKEGTVYISAEFEGRKATIEIEIISLIHDIRSEPYYKYAWHLAYNEEFGKNYNIDKNANINIEEAWKITRGEGVTVAVIDVGNFDWEHEDLKDNVINIYNSDEDDKNISNQGTSDTHSHGSIVSGFIASPVNGKGLVGTAPKSKLILIKQIDASDSATIKAFEYAKEHGAKVINCSWGTNNVSQGVSDAFAQLKEEGITIIFASGNDGQSMDNIINDESELESVIGVGASDENNDIASYSSYGRNIDLIAPGGDLGNGAGILGLDDTGSFGSSIQRSIVNNNYAFTNGTSFASPVTAGVVALILSVNDALTPNQIREILISTTDKIGDTAEYINGFDTYRAYGKLNAAKAVLMARDYKL